MSQTSATAAALIIAFLIFITVRGELPAYFGAFGLGPMPEKAPTEKAGATLTSFTENFGGVGSGTRIVVGGGGGGGGVGGGGGNCDPFFDPYCGGGAGGGYDGCDPYFGCGDDYYNL